LKSEITQLFYDIFLQMTQSWWDGGSIS